jgi:hypothetical protein
MKETVEEIKRIGMWSKHHKQEPNFESGSETTKKLWQGNGRSKVGEKMIW